MKAGGFMKYFLLFCIILLAVLCLSLSAQCQIATPTFNPDGGTYNGSQTVSMSCSTPNATIIYTTDGSEPWPMATEWDCLFITDNYSINNDGESDWMDSRAR